LKQPTSPSPRFTFVEASSHDFPSGSAIGSRVKIRLEDHSVSDPFVGTLADYILDKDYPERGWYVVNLDSPIPVYSDPVTVILIQSRGAAEEDNFEDIPRRGPKGQKVIYYFKNPLEEMLLNSKSIVRYVIIYVATIMDEVILSEKKLTHTQLWIHPFAKASRVVS
jgi:hypothetical protein